MVARSRGFAYDPAICSMSGSPAAFCLCLAEVQGMKFAALTLKESQDNGGDYYILFSNRPPSEEPLPSSDCSAGAALKYGIKPKSKVRKQGQFATTWKSSGTTWKAGVRKVRGRHW